MIWTVLACVVLGLAFAGAFGLVSDLVSMSVILGGDCPHCDVVFEVQTRGKDAGGTALTQLASIRAAHVVACRFRQGRGKAGQSE